MDEDNGMSHKKTTGAKMRVGLLGCGKISQVYANGASLFEEIDLVACADLRPEAASALAEANGLRALSVDELTSAPDIDLVVNLTVPAAHAATTESLLRAGKHVYSEKPLAVSVAEGRELLAVAASSGRRLGCAPDTILGGGLQTVRELLDAGRIGAVHGGSVCMMTRGPDRWHPNPSFFYLRGGGPVFDMGPYYLTALVHFLGPVRSVGAVARRTFDARQAGDPADPRETFPVEVPTHYSGILVFEGGAVISAMFSFDVAGHRHRPIELYGAEGTLIGPDPNTYRGPVECRPAHGEWAEVPLERPFQEQSRGIGVAEMARAIEAGVPHRCNAEVALHVLEVMEAFGRASDSGRFVELETRCEPPPALPADFFATRESD